MIAFQNHSEIEQGVFRDWYTGQPIEQFSGRCLVFFEHGQGWMETGIEKDSGERYWKASTRPAALDKPEVCACH